MALVELDKMLKSPQTTFVGGPNGLQARRCRAIHAHLDLVIRNGRLSADAAERAAETNGFSPSWGGRQLCGWTRQWVTNRKLPESLRGCHAKTASILAIPSIKAELRAYLHSNKWSVNPAKLAKFTANEMLPKEAEMYLRNLVGEEMPLALKNYLELELFPCVHLKVGRGISFPTARRWLHWEGFQYTSHKKGLYFDGHDHADVIEYHQETFLPMLKSFEPQLVRYSVENPNQERPPTDQTNYVECRLVIVAHDEMTVQSNDMKEKDWVFEDEH